MFICFTALFSTDANGKQQLWNGITTINIGDFRISRSHFLSSRVSTVVKIKDTNYQLTDIIYITSNSEEKC